MEQTAAARLLSAEDVILEILVRVSSDVAALFRCAVACKWWCALVADRSFLRRCWPENARLPSTLLGFFVRQGVDVGIRLSHRLFFVPPPAGSVIGAQRRLLSSIVDDLPDDDSHSAEPLAARRGLLLVRLVSRNRRFDLINLAVCDPVAGTCHMLPPLECRVHFLSCTLLTCAEYCSSKVQQHPSLNSFKVLAMTFYKNPDNEHDPEWNLYMFSSTESRWSAPTKCFDDINQLRIEFPIGEGSNVVCGGVAHWLVSCFFDHGEESLKCYTLDVTADTGHTSFTEVSISANQIGTTTFDSRMTLGVTTDGSLSLFCVHDGPHIRRLDMWKRGKDADSEVWLRTRVIELNLPRQPKVFWGVNILPVDKSDKLLIIDEFRCMHKIDVETGEVEEEQHFQNALGTWIVPMTIEWPTLFASRLGYVLESMILC